MQYLYHIGRDKISNDIYIIDESISFSHSQILIDENSDVIIIDLSSKNGVSINNEKIKSPVKLKEGDIINLGNVSFKYQNLLAAIKLVENNKKKGIAENISLMSIIQKEIKDNPNNQNAITKKLLFVATLLLALLVMFFLTNHFNDQRKIKEKLENVKVNTNETTNINTNSEDKTTNINTNSEKKNDTIRPLINKKENKVTKQRTDITYNFSCLSTTDDGGSNEMILEFGDLTRNVQNILLEDIDISIDDEKKAGNSYVDQILKEKRLIKQGDDYVKLNQIMKDLVSRLADPRGISYELFFIDDTIQNVFTLGGNIIFYKGMYDLCANESEIAAIISHEIAHNELGHSILSLKKQQLATDFGIFGEIALVFENMVSTSFNQKQESEADLFGMDLLYATDYNNCASISFWQRMSEKENDFNIVDNLFRSHPYSKNRIECLKRHLTNNYKTSCK